MTDSLSVVDQPNRTCNSDRAAWFIRLEADPTAQVLQLISDILHTHQKNKTIHGQKDTAKIIPLHHPIKDILLNIMLKWSTHTACCEVRSCTSRALFLPKFRFFRFNFWELFVFLPLTVILVIKRVCF